MMTDEARWLGEDTKELFLELVANRDPAVRDRLVTAHLGLAHQLARRYANRGEPYEDLVQVASLAIVKSVDRFDPNRGVEFTTFATRTVIGELKRHFRDKGWAVRAPRRVQELYLELGKVTETLSQELGRSPTVHELAVATAATEEAVLEALEAGQGYRTSSIDATDRNEETLASHIGEDDASFDTIEDRELLAPAIAQLAPRERLILQLRFANGLTQSEIAARVGISQMHVSRLLAASLEQLRRTVAATREDDSAHATSGDRTLPARPEHIPTKPGHPTRGRPTRLDGQAR
ncbi:MAG: SigB/SigF/SigG family RNA polymerase sigma factor [Actinomycetota bacterium]|jgi:RNA polymerase sigma-B factor|nr:SigB/SigF/SigG family RNA polymerase sigma factor [Actinomycetota bacterium]